MPSKLGKYTLFRTLGSGAYSKVKLAQDEETG
jgi:serine/threonine protein kinase